MYTYVLDALFSRCTDGFPSMIGRTKMYIDVGLHQNHLDSMFSQDVNICVLICDCGTT